MGTFLNIDDDPNRISGRAAALRAMAEGFRSESQTILSEIQSIDAERPWASDKYGQAFEKNYTQPAEGQEEPLRDVAQERMQDAGSRLIRVGEQTQLAMAEYQGVDEQGGAEINAANI